MGSGAFAGLCLVLAELRVSREVIEFEHDNLRLRCVLVAVTAPAL